MLQKMDDMAPKKHLVVTALPAADLMPGRVAAGIGSHGARKHLLTGAAPPSTAL